MKKMICCVLAACAAGLSLAALCGCAKESARNQYVINAEYLPEEKLLTAEMSVTVPNLTDNAFEELKFQLYPNAYREIGRASCRERV